MGTLLNEAKIDTSPQILDSLFSRVIELWNDHARAYVKRLKSVKLIDNESEEGLQVLKKFNQQLYAPFEIRKFIHTHKEYSENSYEICCYVETFQANFYPICLDDKMNIKFASPYTIGFNQEAGMICLSKIGVCIHDDYEYLKTVAFENLVKWMKSIDPMKELKKTHELIDKESYSKNYNQLKADHGKEICRLWTEKTNPEKFVFEDCGITTYIKELINAGLIRRPRKFVDIGCGNGLLVYLLNKIGMNGYGLDVRSRKIWKSLFEKTDLREMSVNPQEIIDGSVRLEDGVDLLIGNHSDELTPWIAVMAAVLKCDFFVIPCCPFEFFGKFNSNKKGSGFTSSFDAYFHWVVETCEKLGFEVKTDRMMIPSTKRLCIIGKYSNVEGIGNIITELTKGRRFQARPAEIKNRNCHNIPVDKRELIAKKIFEYLLNAETNVVNGWNTGGAVALKEIANILDDDEKKLMKDQCGGVQTFLRNQHQVFKVYGGFARIKDPRLNEKVADVSKKKKKGCWMAANHPDGCPLDDDNCCFVH